LNPNVRGQAPAATLKAFDDYNDFNQFPSLYTIDNARTSSHSLGQTCNSGYNSNARTSDQQIIAYPSLMHVHSAGNSGTTNCGGLTGGWKTITGGFKSGKNVITVANLSKSDFIDATSSKGPLPDGRLKPDVSAVGASVNSTQPDNNFAVFSGTSMACPAVAGNVAILNQAYKKQNLVEPNSGLIKAILMNTSDDMGNEGPDFTYGFGRINMRRAIECIEGNRFLSGSVVQNGLGTHTIQIPANVFKVKVMVYWVDVAGSVGVSPSLVNDLDATLIAANQTIFKPWQMYAGAVPTNESCNTPAIKGTDTLNNVEQIEIDNPSSGAYQLNVNGTKVPSGPQN
ncbi:MAG TPA: S8 family serine peptidase, partial [Chitinophagaceae bacterium]|nr:S8 family serine peptidase [Chitinophagaceae bacterium]